MATKIAVVGLGAMGGTIAQNLVGRNYDVAGFDLDSAAVRRAEHAGIRAAPSLATCASEADYILTSLPDSEAVRSAWTDREGLIDSALPHAMLIELSSIDPQTMRLIAIDAARRDLRVLDCPVSGGPAEAAAATLALLVGGSSADIDAAQTLLGDIGSQISCTGTIGTGKIVKIVNNMMSLGNVLIAAEAFTIGVTAGVDPEQLLEVLSVSGGRSHHLLKRFPNAIHGDFTPGFKMWLGEKDMRLGLELAHSVAVPAPGAAAIREVYQSAMSAGWQDCDIVAVLRLYQRWADQQPRPADPEGQR